MNVNQVFYRTGFLILLGTFFLGPVFSQNPNKQKDLLVELHNADLNTRTQAAEKESRLRKERIQALLKIAKTKEKRPQLYGPRLLAIELLGEYRAVEALDFLVENVSLKLRGLDDDRHPLVGYPCAISLTKIGSPAISSIFQQMSRPCSETDIDLFANILNEIDGKVVGLVRLQFAAKEADKRNGSVAKSNFEMLLDKYKQLP